MPDQGFRQVDQHLDTDIMLNMYFASCEDQSKFYT